MKIVLTRITVFTLIYSVCLLPCLASFTLDNTFGDGGKLTIAFPDSSTAYSSRGLRIFVQPSGRIIAAGSFTRATADGQLSGVAVVGLTAGGMHDATYVLDWQSNGSTSLNDALMYTDGRLLRLSRFFNVVGSATGKVVRLNANGSSDDTFNSNASIGASGGGFGTVRPYQVAVRSDGKILVLLTENSQFFVYRLNPDGTRDSTFGVNGVVGIAFNKIPSPSVSEMVLLPDGKVLITGNVPPLTFPAGASDDFFLARLTESGNWDKTFGRAGFLRAAFGPGRTGRIQDALLQPDGNILLCGSVSDADLDTWMMRFRPNGRVDTSFGSGGVVINDFTPGGTDAATALAVSADGRIRLVGYAGAPSNFLVARFAANGTFEESTSIPFTAGQYAQANDVTLQPDGKLLVIGETRNPNNSINGSVFAIARLSE